MSGLLTYDSVHSLGRKEPHAVFQAVARCLAVFGGGSEPNAIAMLLDLAADNDPTLMTAYEELREELGPHSHKVRGMGTDGREWRAFEWRLQPAVTEAAFTRAATLHKRNDLLAKRVGVKVSWSFRFRSPQTRQLLPGQDAMPLLQRFRHPDISTIVLTGRRPSSLALWLMFPFERPDDTFREYLTQFQKVLPVRLAPKQWRQWALSQGGEWRARKVVLESGAA